MERVLWGRGDRKYKHKAISYSKVDPVMTFVFQWVAM